MSMPVFFLLNIHSNWTWKVNKTYRTGLATPRKNLLRSGRWTINQERWFLEQVCEKGWEFIKHSGGGFYGRGCLTFVDILWYSVFRQQMQNHDIAARFSRFKHYVRIWYNFHENCWFFFPLVIPIPTHPRLHVLCSLLVRSLLLRFLCRGKTTPALFECCFFLLILVRWLYISAKHQGNKFQFTEWFLVNGLTRVNYWLIHSPFPLGVVRGWNYFSSRLGKASNIANHFLRTNSFNCVF